MNVDYCLYQSMNSNVSLYFFFKILKVKLLILLRINFYLMVMNEALLEKDINTCTYMYTIARFLYCIITDPSFEFSRNAQSMGFEITV